MNYLDLIIAVPLLYGLVKGFANGLIKEVTALISLVVGVYVAINFSEFLEPKFIEVLGGYQEFVPVLAFGVLFLVSVFFIRTLGYVVDKLTKALALGIVSRVLGGVFGFLKVVVVFSFLLFVITDYNLVNEETKNESVLFTPLVDIAAVITPQLKKHQSILDKIEQGAEKTKEKINQQITPE
jgi:membrane protein required for colicin V production